jgi:putative permease
MTMIKYIQSWVKRYFSDPQVIILVLLLLFSLILVLLLGHMLLPVFVAIIIAYLLEGFVSLLQAFRVPRSASVTIVFTLFLALITMILMVVLPLISNQISQFIQELPTMISRGQQELMRLPEKYPQLISHDDINKLFDYINSNITKLGEYILSISISSVRGLIEILVYLVLVPFLVFFFLKDKDIIFQWISSLLPEERGLTQRVWGEVNQQIANYIRGKIWEIIIVWASTYITFFFIGLSFSMILSLLVGLAVLIPYIGATVMFIPITLIAFLQWGIDLHLFYVLASYAIIHAIDGNILQPILLSEVVDLHPVAIIVAILFLAEYGVLGTCIRHTPCNPYPLCSQGMGQQRVQAYSCGYNGPIRDTDRQLLQRQEHVIVLFSSHEVRASVNSSYALKSTAFLFPEGRLNRTSIDYYSPHRTIR